MGWLSGPVQASGGTREFLEQARSQRAAQRLCDGDHRPRCSYCERVLIRRGPWMWCPACQTVAGGSTTDRELCEMGVDLGDIDPSARRLDAR